MLPMYAAGVRTKSWTPLASGLEVRMYSDEDRQAILELLRESGMPPGRFARESGLASETALRGWLSGSPRVGWHPPYTVAQRAEAARRALAGEDPAAVAAGLGCHPETVRGWARAARREGAVSLASRRDLEVAPPPCVLSTRYEQNEHRNLSSLRTRRAQAF